MFKQEEIYRELARSVASLKKSTHKPIVTCQSRVTNVKPLAGMTSDLPASVRVRKTEPLPDNVKAVWRF